MLPANTIPATVSFEDLEQALTNEARWDELLHLYEGRLERDLEGPQAALIMARAASLLLEKLEDPVRAEGWLRRLLERDPENVVGREGLQQLFEERGDHEALSDLLEREAARAPTPELAAEAYLELGKLLDEELDRKPRALVMWQRALRLVEDHPEALRLSREGYVALGRLDAAKGILDRELAARPEEAAAHALRYAELGRIALEQPFSHELAAACAEAALAADPTSSAAASLVADLQRLRDDWMSEVRALRAAALDERDRKVASGLYLKAAALHAAFDRGDDAEAQSRENLERAFLLWPGNPEALEFLEHRHVANGDFAGLASAYEALVGVTPERSGQAELHARLASLWSVRFDDKERSVAALEQAAALDPARSEAVVPLLEHLEDEGQLEAAAELLERHLAAAPRSGRTNDLRLRLAEIYLEQGDRDRARGQLESALRQDPRLEKAEHLLEPLLDTPDRAASLARLLERRSDRLRDPVARRELLVRAAALLRDAPAERLRLLGRILLLPPGDGKIYSELEAIGRESAASETVVRLYQAALASADDHALRLRLLIRLAHVFEVDLGRASEAAACLRQAVALAPDDADLAADLERTMGLAGEHAALVAGYLQTLETTRDPARRRPLLLKLAAHHEERGHDPAALVDVYRELLEEEPDPELQRKLAAALGSLSRWSEQRAILVELAKAPGATGLDARSELATLLATRLGEPAVAAELHLGVLKERPDSEPTVLALEALLQGGNAVGPIGDALAPIFEARGEWHRFAGLLDARLGAETDPVRRQAIFLSLARVQADHLGDLRGAFTALSRAFAEAPASGELLVGLRRLAGELSAQLELCGLLAAAWRSGDAALDREFASCAVSLAEGVGGDPEIEAAAHQRLLELDPTDARALASLEAIAAAAGRWAEATGMVERLLAVESAPEQRATRELRLSGYLRRLGQHADAARAMQAALGAGADEEEVLPTLADSLERAGLHPELAEVLSRQIERATAAGEGDVAARLGLHRARILEELGSKVAAVADYAAILKERPFDPDAILGLESLLSDPEARVAAARALEKSYVAGSEWRKLHGVLEIQIQGSADPAYRARELRRLAQLSARELQSPALAFGALARAFEEAPGDPLLRSELRVAADEADCLEELAALMGEVAEQRSGSVPVPQLLALEREIAELYEKRLRDPGAAITRYVRMQRLDPSSLDALRGLHRLYRESGEWQGLYDVALALASAVNDLRERVSLWREAAKIGDEQLRDPVRAATCWRLIADADPTDGEALVQLDGLYVAQERWGDLAWTVEKRRALALHAGEGFAATELAHRLAELRQTNGDAHGALDLYREVLAAAPDHADARAALDRWARSSEAGSAQALDLLDRVLRAAGQHERRLELRDARLAAAVGADERARRFEELRLICEDDLQRPDMAYAVCAKAFAEGVEKDTAHLERLAQKSGRFADLAELYEATLRRDPEAPSALRRRAAELREGELRDAAGAIALWRAIAAETPDDPQALDALERLYRAEGRHRELVTTLERKADLEADTESRKGIYIEMARLLADPLGDPDHAIEAARRAFALDEADPRSLDLLGWLFSETHRWEDLAGLLALRIERMEDAAEERRALEFELGRLRQGRLGDPDGALALYRAILADDPGHAQTLQAVEELAADPDPIRRAAAAALLAPLFAAAGDHRRQVEALESLAASQTDPSQRAATYAAVAAIYAGPLEAKELAFFAAGRALRADPDDPAHLELARSSSSAAGLDEELAGLLAECADGARTLEARLALARMRATLLEAEGDEAAALEAWRQLRSLAPQDLEALRSLARLEGSGGDPLERLEVLRALLAKEKDPADRAARLLEIASVQEERLEDPIGAMETLQRVLEIEPSHLAALEGLDRLCLVTERWAELDGVLTKKAEASRDDVAARHRILVRLADLRESHLGDREGALDLLQQVSAEDPAHLPARETLEAIVEASPGALDAAALLEAACRASGDWQRVAELIEQRIAIIPDPEARKEALLELGGLRRDRQGRADLAFLAFERAFREEPSDPAVWPQVASAAHGADLDEEWVAIAEGELPRIQDPAVAADLALHLASIGETILHDDESASRWFERADELDAGKAADVLPALERLYPRLERWRSLAGVLERQADRADPRSRGAILVRLGQLAVEKLGDPDRAMVAYEAALALDPDDRVALNALEPLYEGAGANEKLLDILVAQRALATPDTAPNRLLQRVADLAAPLGRIDLAIETSREILGRDPRNDLAHQRLEALFEEAGRWDDLASLLRERIAHTLDPRELGRLHERLGALLREQMADPDAAAASYRAVLDRDPRNRKALEALRELHGQSGDAEALAGVLRRLIPLQEATAGVKAVRLELAGAFIGLDRGGEAIDSLKRILDLEPHDPAELEKAESLFRVLSAWPEVIRTLELRAGLEPDEQAVERWAEVARIYDEELGRREAGAPSLEKILEKKPDDRGAFDRLRELYRGAADWRRYAAATERFGTLIRDEAERVSLLRELSEVHESRLGQKEFAFAKLSAAFEITPDDESLRADLERLAAACEMREELAMIYESVAEARAGRPDAAPFWFARGRLLEGELDDVEGAEASYRRILEVDPRDRGALDALGALLARGGDDRARVAVLEQQLEACEPEEKRALLQAIAAIHDEKLGDPGEAIYSLRRAFELDPGDAEILESLVALFRREERFADLAALLARSRDLARTPDQRIALQLRLAAVQENDLGDAAAAIDSYGAALELEPASEEAMEALERLYTKDDRYAELLGLYDRKLRLTDDAAERSRIFVKAGGIWEEKLQNPVNAIACFDGVLALEPDNVRALRKLDRLLVEQRSWERLAAILRRLDEVLAANPSHAQERLEIRVRLGELLLGELRQSLEAEEVFAATLDLDERCRPAIRGLATIYEASGNWTQALAMLERESRLVDEVSEAVAIHARVARIHGEILGDKDAARAAYERVLEIDPGHLPSIRGLRTIFESGDDEEGALRSLEQEASYTEDPAEKTRLYDEIGRHHLEVRQEPEEAIRAFEEARRHSPGDLPAALALSDLYVERERWAEAEVVLDVVCSHLAEAGESPELLTHKVYRLGFVAARLGKDEKARQSFERAYELDPTFLPAAEGLGAILARIGDHARALKVYQAILIHHRGDLTDPEVVEVYFTIGDLRRKLGDGKAAQTSLKNALGLDAWHLDSHRAMIALAEEEGDAELAISHRQKLVEIVEEDEKVAQLRAIAEAASKQLGDHYLAIDSLAAAQRLRPDDFDITEGLIDLYRETRQGLRLVELLEELVARPAVQADPEKAIRFHSLLGASFREEAVQDPEARERAAAHFNAALDLDWRQTPAFQALEAMLVEAKDWRLLEANYLRMLERLGKVEGTGKVRAVLYRTLGDLYLEALADSAAAIEAYKGVTLLAPEDADAAQTYAGLVAQVRGSEEEAIAAWRHALPLSADLLPAAKSMMRLHARRKSYDAAFATAQVTSFLLKSGGADEQAILDRLQAFGKDSATGALTDKLWRELVYHPEQRGPIGGILAIVQTEAGAIFARDPGSLHIQGRDVRIDRKRDRVDVATSMLFFVNAYRYVANTLGMEAMELYKVAGIAGLTLADTWPHCLVAGEELFTDQRPKKELYFQIGRILAWSRPELSMVLLRPRDQLQLIVESAAALGDPSIPTRYDPKTVERVRRQLGKAISPAGRQRLKTLAAAYATQRPDLGAYLEAAEFTATRAGALLAGDLRVVARCLSDGAGKDPELEARRLRDLAIFCLSDAWIRLRKELGTAVEVPG